MGSKRTNYEDNTNADKSSYMMGVLKGVFRKFRCPAIFSTGRSTKCSTTCKSTSSSSSSTSCKSCHGSFPRCTTPTFSTIVHKCHKKFEPWEPDWLSISYWLQALVWIYCFTLFVPWDEVKKGFIYIYLYRKKNKWRGKQKISHIATDS